MTEVTFDWNDETIRFADWQSDAFGVYEYQTRNRRHCFRFELRLVGRCVRIYILEQPGYGGRPDDGHSTHRLHDGAFYVCVRGDLQPDNVPDALSWAVFWAEQTGRYIDTGARFS